jgi:hypothetical protein
MERDGVACTLPGGTFEERVAAWRDVTARATARAVEPGRVIASYPDDPALRERVTDLIAAEGRCCSFMEFEIREGVGEFFLELRYPDAARHLVEAIVPVAANG